MTGISLIEIAFFTFWIWTLMDLINQEGIEEHKKARMITFHTFLGLIGIAFYFFLLISVFASEEVLNLKVKGDVAINQATYSQIVSLLQPALVFAFIVILLFPVVAGLNLIFKKNLQAKKHITAVNILEGLAILGSFVYILLVTSGLEDINYKGPYLYLSLIHI